jgi:hypothetical protein
MSFDLHVSILREVRVGEEFEAARTVLADMLRLSAAPQLSWEYPKCPKVKAGVQDVLSDGTSFYVVLPELGQESLVDFGVSEVKKYGMDEPPFASFSVRDEPGQNVLALAMAIALAQLVHGKVEDGSSHWFTPEVSDPTELLTKFRVEEMPKSLREAVARVDATLRRGRISIAPNR